ncbi:WxL domain-containing protein [Enterococcus faecalis]|uniref:WxL domain-containing protein n=1 Tax=Enterococcus faecalis TaxID=1351 RepID=UPI003D09E438
MNKTYLSTIALGIGLVSGAAQTVHAEDTSKESTASITVNPGSLSIKDVTNITFPEYTIDGKDHNDLAEDSTNKSKVVVNDFRSADTGWQMKAKIKEIRTIPGISLKFAPVLTENENHATVTPVTLNEEEQVVASVDKEQILSSELVTKFDLGATMDIPKNTKAGNYTATIVWSLEEVPNA